MKRPITFLLTMCSMVALTSCGVNSALVLNHNQNSTQVLLSQNNFKVAERVSGSAEVRYVLFIGGMRQTRLYANAYADMINKAGLTAGPKALTNYITEEHLGGVPPFFYKRTVTVSAQVIEFTE